MKDKDVLEALGFAMTFGHRPTPHETLAELRSQGYDIVKKEPDEYSGEKK